MSELAVVLGDQLFEGLPGMPESIPLFMREDRGLATKYRHHQQKIVLFFSAMRHFAQSCGREVIYQQFQPDSGSFYDELARVCRERGITKIWVYSPNDPASFDLNQLPVPYQVVKQNPMFLTPPEEWRNYTSTTSRRQMSDFYIRQRKRLGILIDQDGAPVGGKWSFDVENRKRLPSNVHPPRVAHFDPDPLTKEVIRLVTDHFPDHPGNAANFEYGVTHSEARERLSDFIRDQLSLFGDYEDAIPQRERTLFHSILTPYLNCGLLTPAEVVREVIEADVPLNSKEGFIRQIIGWREFMFGMKDHYLQVPNHFGNSRLLNSAWYEGTTGLPPVDEAIRRVNRHAYCHHIERLMVLGSVMLMSEVHPEDAYRWFMEMFIDSAEWVMGPNVYGMSQFADGGTFATKPYVSGSAYILKMSDYKPGEWCDVWDGLYWRFILKHEETFAKNHRMTMMVKAAHQLDPGRKERILRA
ncbi:MAG TPA: cryptochrome/photolyase family protein, partial [Fimbriimonas sp.]|nr:cryptochrome/photolyase family protein [Fimbriimonas sp.]